MKLAPFLLAGLMLLGPDRALAREDPFAPLGLLVSPPSAVRSATGAPGPGYWQQKVDYRLTAKLDEQAKSLTGEAEITYHNNAPEPLDHLWLLLDQNRFRADSLRELTRTTRPGAALTAEELERSMRLAGWRGGFTMNTVEDETGKPLAYTVNDALMRLDLPRPVPSHGVVRLKLRWTLPMIETAVLVGRSGYRCFNAPGEDGACIFQAGQWFPRLAAFDDEGWHNDPFLGVGEFPLEFGDYEVAISVPKGMVVAGGGVLQNPAEVLTPIQQRRLAQAKEASTPVIVVTPDEAAGARRGTSADGTSTWRFRASNVRDFAFAASRTYIWDAMAAPAGDGARHVLAMSFYPDEGRPLWSTYASKAMVYTLKSYGERAGPYPYPVVQASFGEVSGYENPMLSFDDVLPARDPKTGAITYSEGRKNALIATIIHETGHNWFPEMVNSDERRNAWMDEGLNTFLEYQARAGWAPGFPRGAGEPRTIAPRCLAAADRSPIMVRPDYSIDNSCTAYARPGAALNVLREAVLGPETFDRAFRAYADRWRFKRATPADFFRTFEDVTGADLAWFWRGWFYGTDKVDIALEEIVRLQTAKAAEPSAPPVAGRYAVDEDPSLKDWYDQRAQAGSTVLPAAVRDFIYRLTFRNRGGLVSPIPLELGFEDGSRQRVTLPAQIWRADPTTAHWRVVTAKPLAYALIDPDNVTADADTTNNRFPRLIGSETVKLETPESSPNTMQRAGVQVMRNSIEPVGPTPPKANP